MSDNVIEFRLRAVDEFENVFRSLATSLSTVGKVAGITVTALAALGAGALAVTKHAADLQEEVNALSDKLGVSVEALSAWQHAAELADVSRDSLSSGIQFLNKTIGEASDGSAQAVKAFSDLGLSFTDANGGIKTAEQLMPELADKIEAMGSAAQRTRTEMTFLGRGGVELNKILKDGSEAFREAARDAELLGVVMNKQSTANASLFNDQFDRMKAAVKGVAIAFGNELIPVLTGVFHNIANGIASSRESFRTFGKIAADAFIATLVAAEMLKEGLAKIWIGFKQAGLNFIEAIGLEPKDVATTFDNVLKITVEFVRHMSVTLVESFKFVWETFTEMSSVAFQNMKNFATGSFDEMISVGSILDRTLPQYFENVGKSGEKAWTSIVDESQTAMDSINDLLTGNSFLAEFKARMQTMREELTMTAQVETETVKNTVERTLEQRYRLHEEEMRLLNDKLTAQIFYAESTTQVMDLALTQWAAKADTVNEVLSKTIQGTMDTMVSGVSNAMARSLVYGEKFSDALKATFKQAVAHMISQLIELGIQQLILAAIGRTSAATQASASLAGGLSEVFVNSYASAAAIPVVGWAMAPGVAAANLAGATAGAAAAMAAGAGMGAAVGAAHGGLGFVPSESTWLLDKGERVVSPQQNRDLTEFLDGQDQEDGGGGGGVRIENLTIHVLENATSFDALMALDSRQLRDLISLKLYPAMKLLDQQGVRPVFVERYAR